MRCGDHDLELEPLSYGTDGMVIVQCVCGQEYAEEDDTLVPVDPPVRDHDHDDPRGIELDSHWGPLLSGIAVEPREADVGL